MTSGAQEISPYGPLDNNEKQPDVEENSSLQRSNLYYFRISFELGSLRC